MFFSERVFLQITLWLIIAITPYQSHTVIYLSTLVRSDYTQNVTS